MPDEPVSHDPAPEDAKPRRSGLRRQATAAVLLAVVGFAGIVQVQANQRDDDYEGMREEDLVQLLNSLTNASQRAENEIADLEQTRSSLLGDTQARRVALEQARERATALGILAGTVPAQGQGIVVRIEDPEGKVGIDQMLNGIEELRDGGAEAMELNDSVRIVAQTALEDGDGGIVVDGVELSPPYTLEVIGAPDTLEGVLTIYRGFAEDVEHPTVGGRVTIEKRDDVEVGSLAEPLEPEFAEPVPTE